MKNSKKIQNIENPLLAFFSAKTGLDWQKKSEKKILVQNSVHTRPVEENSEKKLAKKFKTLKNLFLALFLARTG